MQSQNQRASQRFQVAIRAGVVNPENDDKFQCIIRDGSISGCKIVCSHMDSLPDRIVLDVPDLSHSIHGRIVWRNDHEAGIAFQWEKSGKDQCRGAPRHGVNMPAVVRSRDFEPLADCTLHDASRSGCRIELHDDSDIPEDIRLEIKGLTEAVMTRIVWRKGNMAGIKFLWGNDVYLLDDTQVQQNTT